MTDWETLKLLHNFAIAEGVFRPQKVSGVEVEPCKPLILVDESGDPSDNDDSLLLPPNVAIADMLAKLFREYGEIFAGDIYVSSQELNGDGFWLNEADKFIEKLYNLSFNDGHQVLIWDKVLAGTGYTYRTVHEYVLMLWKGKKRKLNHLSTTDVLRYPKPWGKKRIFPTQKSQALIELLIGQSTQEGETVLDMFLGSGTSGVAAVRMNRNFIGIEKNPKTLELARCEIENAISVQQTGFPADFLSNLL